MNAELTKDQARRVQRARKVLAAEHGHDTADLAARIGQLEWWLGDMVKLIGTLTEQDFNRA